MRALNRAEIKQRSRYFALHFFLLLLVSLLAVYGYFQTALLEMDLLNKKTKNYDRLILAYNQLAEKMDTVYYYVNLLNTHQVHNNLFLQRLIGMKREEAIRFTLHSHDQQDTLDNFTIYKQLTGDFFMAFMALKDSINRASTDERLLRKDLINCINNRDELEDLNPTLASDDTSSHDEIIFNWSGS